MIILLSLLLFLVQPLMAITTQQLNESETPEQVARDANIIIQGTLPSSGGDKLFYRDTRNQRIGIGTKTPSATLDVYGLMQVYYRTSAQIDALVPTGTFQLVGNSTLNVICFSTGTGAGAFVRINSTSTACR